MMTIIDTHIHNVKKALDEDGREAWCFIEGATDEEIARLRQAYPLCPQELTDLLRKIGGTYHRQYSGGYIAQPIFGSDLKDYGYYLLSCDDMLEEQRMYSDSIAEQYDDFMDDPDIIYVAPEIDINVPSSNRLCFAHCINNGGTSRLYIDFSPTGTGTVGQVVRYLHDPDSFIVLAPSFADYITQLTQASYGYVPDDPDEYYSNNL